MFVAGATFTGSPLPSCGATKSSSSPLASDQYAIHFPSGDQTAFRSRTPLVRVTFRVLPFSAGTVKTSPRAVRTAREPPGARAKSVILSSTFTQRGRAHFRSSGRSTVTFRLCPLLVSRRYRKPPFSKTIASPPPPPPCGHFTSYSWNEVARVIAFVATSYFQRFPFQPSRSERK